MQQDLKGKCILLTGATEGIGKAAAHAFAERGATLVLIARNQDKGARVVAELKAASANEAVELIVADMSSIASVRDAAAAYLARHDRLDVLVNNAGALFDRYALSADGIEMTFALNHVGYQLLTVLLLDVLKRTPGARVISTTSGAHFASKIDLSTVVKRNGKAGFPAYSDSKLANILFTRELARRLEGTGVKALCFHPGFVRSGFGMNNGKLYATVIKSLGALFARSPQKGAETLVWLATADDVQVGGYYANKKLRPTSSRARDQALGTSLWTLTETLYAA